MFLDRGVGGKKWRQQSEVKDIFEVIRATDRWEMDENSQTVCGPVKENALDFHRDLTVRVSSSSLSCPI